MTLPALTRRLLATGLLTLCVLAIASNAKGDDIRDNAAERIEQYRKADASIQVRLADGTPVSQAEVNISQTSHAFLFGCNVFLFGRVGNENDEKAYRDRFAELFNFATLPFYWASYERRRDQPDHARTEQIARWCQEQGIRTKGHPLAWNYSDPRWLPDDPEETRSLQMARIDDCVQRHQGLIDCWDVVNEATHFERDSFQQRAPKMTEMWSTVGRIEFVRECFDHARAANSRATLLINDYRTDPPYEALLEKLRGANGKPIFDVIGIQSHMHSGTWSNQKVWDVCERYDQFNLPLHFTETTILSGQRGWKRADGGEPWPSTPEGETWQADEVERIYTLLFSHPAVEAITWWDLSDRRAWQRAPAGLLREDLSGKPAYHRLLGLVKRQWWTQITQRTDAEGRVAFRGFLGDYQITVTTEDQTVTQPLVLGADMDNTLVVEFE